SQLVVEPEDEPGEDLAAEPTRTDAVAGVAGAVVDLRSGNGAEKREVVGRHVDRPAPRAFDPRAREVGQETAQARLGPGRSRDVFAEASVDSAAEADRPRAAAHDDAAVVRRAEVVEEHAAVEDRLPPGPVDRREQL